MKYITEKREREKQKKTPSASRRWPILFPFAVCHFHWEPHLRGDGHPVGRRCSPARLAAVEGRPRRHLTLKGRAPGAACGRHWHLEAEREKGACRSNSARVEGGTVAGQRMCPGDSDDVMMRRCSDDATTVCDETLVMMWRWWSMMWCDDQRCCVMM